MNRLNPTTIALLAGALVVLLLVFLLARGGNENSDKLTDDQIAGRGAAVDPEKQCASQSTYDLIERELFRRAAQLRGTNQAAFDKIAASSAVRMDAPMLKSHDEQLGATVCTGTLSLDLPPGVAVVGGRRTLTADIEYTLQRAADSSRDVLMLNNADAIITPLATLAQVGAQTADPLAAANQVDAPTAGPFTPEPLPSEPPPVSQAPRAAPTPRPSPTANQTARPSFNCGNARTRSEIAVCNNPGLAGLDRQMAARYNGAMSDADGGQRAALQNTRDRFLAYRERCRSEECIADAYRGRMREISDIISDR